MLREIAGEHPDIDDVLRNARYRCCCCSEHRIGARLMDVDSVASIESKVKLIPLCDICNQGIEMNDLLRLCRLCENWCDICARYIDFLHDQTAHVNQFYFMNIPWLVRLFRDVTGTDVSEDISAHFLFEKASRLTPGDQLKFLVFMENLTRKMLRQAESVFLDTALEDLVFGRELSSPLILFNHDFRSSGLPINMSAVDETFSAIGYLRRKQQVSGRKCQTEMTIDPKFLVSGTSLDRIRGLSVVSGIGQFVSAQSKAGELQLTLRALALGTSGPNFGDDHSSRIMFYDEFKQYRNSIGRFESTFYHK